MGQGWATEVVPRQSPWPQVASGLVREKAAMSMWYNYNMHMKKGFEISGVVGVGVGGGLFDYTRDQDPLNAPMQALFRKLDERCEDGREGVAGEKVLGTKAQQV